MPSSSLSPYDPLRTEELLAQMRDGDQDAWREVYRRYQVSLTLAARKASGLAIGEAEDVVQSCFLSAWNHLRTFEYRGEGSFRAWLTRIVVTKSSEFHRRASRTLLRRRQVQGGTRTESWWLGVHPDGGKNPADSVATTDEHERLVEQMAEILTPEEHELVVLRYFEELPTPRILEVMEITRPVSRRLHRSAILKIERALGGAPG